MEPEPLLKTKLFMPQVRPEVIERSRLISQLNAGRHSPLTLVSAPAGFGKTTLLAEWATLQKDEGGRRKDENKEPENELHPSSLTRSVHPFKVVWLSLDEGDNDLARFFTYFITALQNVLPGVGEAALLAFRSPQPPPVETLLTRLINEIASEATSFALVLDDYHLIKARPIHQAMTFLLDHIPAPLHLVIATRTDPPLPLARLRGRRQLTELRAADLRFTTEEAATFLNRVMDLPLSSEDVAALEARTEGWIVGLQLAALSMVGRDISRIPDFIAAFTGSHHYVLDYLAEEVLQRQPEAVQTFLLYTSILDRLCGPLCDAVLGRGAEGQGSRGETFITPAPLHPCTPASSQETLEYLEQNNLFIIPLDDERRWYRYHHLFADLLHSQLNRLYPGLAPELHRRASQWHEGNGLMNEAVQHVLAANDWPKAADLVGQYAWPLFNQGEMMTLLGWLTALPEELIRTRPNLCLYHAWILVLTGQVEAVEPRLQQAEQHLPQPATSAESREMLGHVAGIRAYVASLKGEAAHGVALAHQALHYLPEHDLMTRSVINTILGTSSLLAGDVLGACQALTEAGEMARAVDNIQTAVAALIILAAQQMVLGRLHQAAETLQTALDLTTGREGKFLPLAGSVYWGLSKLHYEWNNLEAATCYAEESLETGKLLGTSELLTGAPLALARARRARGDLDGAYEAFQQADQFVRQHKVLPWDVAGVEAGRVWLWLAPGGGDRAAAARWAEARENVLQTEGELPYPQEREHLALVRVLLALERSDDALDLLARLSVAAKAGRRMGRVIEMLVLEAVARQARGELKPAISLLEQALALAEPEGYIRTFVDEGTVVASLLRRIAARDREAGGRRKEYIHKLLTAFEKDTNVRLDGKDEKSFHPSREAFSLHPLGEPLSEREVEVLREMAAGLSNVEIAQRLVIATSTVKRHINHIFSKLGVTTRIQAIVKAKELGLL